MSTVAGLSLRVVVEREHGEVRDAISHDWVGYLEGLGVVPVLIPNALRDPVAFARQTGVRALLLTGGGDVGPPGGCGGPEGLRDATEGKLLALAVAARLPVLGVCRGMQALNVHFGGGLERDLTGVCGDRDRHRGTAHGIEIVDAAWRARLGAAVATVNSFHGHAVTGATLSAELLPFALSSDGVVEGFHHPRLPIVGIQWHPERPGSAVAVDRAIMEHWLGGVAACTW